MPNAMPHDSIRDDDPSVQHLLHAVKCLHPDVLILAAWQVARVLTVRLVEAVLAERAHRPSPGPAARCGVSLRSKGLPRVSSRAYLDRSGGAAGWAAVPRAVPSRRSRRSMRHWGCSPINGASGELQALGCALAVFVPFATAARLLGWYCREHGQCPRRLVLGASGWPPGHGAPPGRPGRRGPGPRADARATAG